MLFNIPEYANFLAAVLQLYYILRRRWQNWMLVGASYLIHEGDGTAGSFTGEHFFRFQTFEQVRCREIIVCSGCSISGVSRSAGDCFYTLTAVSITLILIIIVTNHV
jgi:hypothetical protein